MKLSEATLVHRGPSRPRSDHSSPQSKPADPGSPEQTVTLFSKLRHSGTASQVDHRKKSNNRKSLEFPPRKIHDAQCVANRVKKSFSFDEPCANASTNCAAIVEDKKPVRVVRLGATHHKPLAVEPATLVSSHWSDGNAPVKCISVIDDIDCDTVRSVVVNQESRLSDEAKCILKQKTRAGETFENSASDSSVKYQVNSETASRLSGSSNESEICETSNEFVLNLKSTVAGYFSKRLSDGDTNQNNSTTGRSIVENKTPVESPTGLKAALSGYFDKVLSEESRRRLFGGEKAVKGSQLCRELRGRSGSKAGLRCRSSPPPPPSVCPGGGEGSAGGRLCRTWYGGYGTLTEDGDTFAEKKTPGVVAGLTGAGCGGGRRRADARRRRLPLDHPHHPPSAVAAARLSASTVSLNILPRISAAVIPLRRKDRADADLSKSAAPLLQRENSAPVLNMNSPPTPLTPPHMSNLKRTDFSKSAVPLTGLSQMDHPFASGMSGMRKCETVSGFSGFEPQRAVNRLRPGGVCSRCSSLLSLAASGSRYSLGAAGGFVAVSSVDEETVLCKLCLEDVPSKEVTNIEHCGCSFCTKCMQAYAEYEIVNGAYDISCPDSGCQKQGVMRPVEVEALVPLDLVDKHRKFRLNHEVAMDGCRAFCPRAGCETVCRVTSEGAGPVSGIGAAPPQPVRCPTCAHHFCSACTNQWHGGMDCAAYSRHLALEAGLVGGLSGGDAIAAGLPAESDLIKWCPMCRVPIEKDEGCAQMMCKRCKHVFCWYCLASLDDDFLLRHYDKGPCKNKLGHSRASVIWHRAQVVGIFAGFGLLLLVASPLLLLAAPCIVCCKCRLCNSNEGKNIDTDEAEGDDSDEIQRITDVPIE